MKKVGAEQESLGQKVYESLRDAIIHGELVPGSLHSVQSLAASLDTSRTPVREALLKLADQGMVKFERNRGTRILQTSIHDLEEMFSIRLLLEIPAAYRAAQQATASDLREMHRALDSMRRLSEQESASPKKHLEPDARFHRAIIIAAGNKRMAAIVDNIFNLQMIRGVSNWGISRSAAEICLDHEGILRHIENRDAAAAARAMRDHITVTARITIAQEARGEVAADGFDLPFLDLIVTPE